MSILTGQESNLETNIAIRKKPIKDNLESSLQQEYAQKDSQETEFVSMTVELLFEESKAS
ncbi:hypothetical protein A0J61_08504 [Choanephora cucurbitarum]|uniref:Uncharacterized protein n=1 Tax=Choanephora cucurbitarum TaxID=101091 RepID=A0A1C7N7Y3_9FUNG|nr:hypothetical protein A0J61_08504 [Choanephora cucurbitarum]